jgi:RHH-type proline utilization regulon transcriptional repressor/proline dehydrogenase/delta 1-pyrroline-5-carboxylate dehydrogenase
MIGAVVGVQPFGGEGLSGTGPKAGGPLYLERLRRAQHALLDPVSLGAQREVPVVLDALMALGEWGDPVLAKRCNELAALTPLACTIELPGPTGETNRQTFHPRRTVWCEADNRTALLEQLAVVFATGNRAVCAQRMQPLLPSDLPDAVRASIDVVPDPVVGDVDLALCALPAQAAQLRRLLAARDGARTRVVTPIHGEYPLIWLVVERVVTVNTAAAGGNASLMTLEPA